ncbi:hypothetical protein Golomagni_06449 [Golovinomyces magnicellulatus]|nr:hypothetical protein Golomagni_06449 [Golovinomyces magnicellulatus]
MTIYSDPPKALPFRHDKPTLLVCWWMTSFCSVMILLRIIGRFIRTERLFREDKLAGLAALPLIMRMVCVHFILEFGTNNADYSDMPLTDEELRRKSIASGLVLLSRILYAATLWLLKMAILEFLKRLTDLTWHRRHQTMLVIIRWIFIATFCAVVISDLTECRPFKHYWQVLPDPGGRCRQGYAQLITMATCNVITDLMLVIFPIPIILRSHMTVKRKVQLGMLFSLSLAVVAVTLYRVPHIIDKHGRQQYRSLLASVEILFATTAANALVLGSFVRDRGVKKQKFRRTSSTAESLDRQSTNPRRPTLHQHWGSDEDLVRDVGLTVEPHLRQASANTGTDHFTPAPIVQQTVDEEDEWKAPDRSPESVQTSDDPLSGFYRLSKSESQTGRKISFFDVGGLLENSPPKSSSSYQRASYTSSSAEPIFSNPFPQATVPAAPNGVHRGSTALLQDLGGFLGPRNGRSKSKSSTDTDITPPAGRRESRVPQGAHLQISDPGGLLR